MKYTNIARALFSKNRKKFFEHMQENSIAVFNSNDIFVTSADSTLPFKQHSDIFYLSGIDQEESILVMHKTTSTQKSYLFLKETSELIRIWEGEKYTKQTAFETSGIQEVQWLDAFEKTLNNLIIKSNQIYINKNIHSRANTETQTREDRFIDWCEQTYPSKTYKESAPILHHIRSVKEPEEIELLQQACKITEKGFRRILSFIKPGVWEYEIEAELIHEFIKNKSNGFSYTPIIASGENACVLHYIYNNKPCKDGDVILMDFGANYANYCSDLTRCVPVSGRFSKRQKQVYNAVLQVKKEATKLLRPGTMLSEYHKQVGLIMQSQLIDLGLIDKADVQNQDPKHPAYKKYFMHGTSHFLGLDTHDVGHWDKPIKANMCFTVEPGIYIKEEGLGIRLEDDVLVQPSGDPKNLMENIPIETEEIEELMNA